MTLSRRSLLYGLAAPAILGSAPRTWAGAGSPVKIGALSDLSSAYADISGPALVKAIAMAIADFGPCLGQPVELISADCQLKPDVSSAIARQWWDKDGVDAIADLPSSAAALAVMQISESKKRIVLATSPGTSEITGKSCSPYTSQWAWDTYGIAHTMGKAVVERGGDSWYFIAADYVFGASLVTELSGVVQAAGGKVLGVSRAPLNTSDFSSYLLEAQNSGAKVVALANAGGDTINAIKQAAEFGLHARGQTLAALVLMDTDVHSIGLQAAQGTLLATSFYWDRTEASRAWSRRFFATVGRMPTMLQAAGYSQVTHYLRAVQAAGTKDADAVMARMRETPVDDFYASNAYLRRDGRLIHDMYLAEVKSPQQSHESWDQYTLLATVKGESAARPLSEGGCRLAA